MGFHIPAILYLFLLLFFKVVLFTKGPYFQWQMINDNTIIKITMKIIITMTVTNDSDDNDYD